MGLGNVIVLAQVTAFLLSFILSFFLFVPLSANSHEFDGHCLLYATGRWKTNTTQQGTQLTEVLWGPDSACGFNIFMGVVIMLVSLFYVVWQSLHLFKDTDSSFLEAFLTMIVTVLVTIMLFSATLTLTVGFNKWCDLLAQKPSEIDSCETAEFIPFAEMYNIDSQNFFVEMKMAEFGGWANFVVWLFLMVIAFSKVYRYHRQEAFLTSMNRERERLLQKVGHTPVTATA